jgi:hypothetical protein
MQNSIKTKNTALFYTIYLGFWKFSVRNLEAGHSEPNLNIQEPFKVPK